MYVNQRKKYSKSVKVTLILLFVIFSISLLLLTHNTYKKQNYSIQIPKKAIELFEKEPEFKVGNDDPELL